VRRLEDATALWPRKGPAQILVVRDQRVLALKVGRPAKAGDAGAVQLMPIAGDKARRARRAWLGG
jgi:hypothetical protein